VRSCSVLHHMRHYSNLTGMVLNNLDKYKVLTTLQLGFTIYKEFSSRKATRTIGTVAWSVLRQCSIRKDRKLPAVA
jgi:hypothetical protein